MNAFPTVLIFVLILVMLQRSVKVVNENQRAVLFRLGKFVKIFEPGLVITVPFIDKLLKVDLGQKVPGWQNLGQEELERKVKAIALEDLK